jgi:hypothetical protein
MGALLSTSLGHLNVTRSIAVNKPMLLVSVDAGTDNVDEDLVVYHLDYYD